MRKYLKFFPGAILVILVLPFNLTRDMTTDGRVISPRSVYAASRDSLANVNSCQNFSKNNAETRIFKYVLDGQQGEVSTTVYPDLAKCLHKMDKSTSAPDAPHAVSEDQDDALMINNVPQTESLQELVENIKRITPDKNDQAKIAISLVQGIKYEDNDPDDYDFPYEVIYEQTGICNETGKLLLNILKQLGFGSAMLTFEKDNHQAVGIKCDDQYGFQGSGYCFVEPTTRAIVTDNVEENTPVRVNKISDGLTFDAFRDYQDAQQYISITSKKHPSSEERDIISKLKEEYGLI